MQFEGAPPRRSKRLVTGMLVVVIVVSVAVSVYFYADYKLSMALREIFQNFEARNLRIKSFSVIPPSMDFEVDLILRNPTDTPVNLRCVSVAFYTGEGILFGKIDEQNILIPAYGFGSMTLKGRMDLPTALALKETKKTIISGRIVASTNIGPIEVTKEIPIKLEQAAEKFQTPLLRE